MIRLSLFFKTLVFSSSKGYSLRSGTSLSYTRAREVVLAKFRAIGVDTSGIGLHSLRIGGASAALNSGVPDHVIKNHGRCKSDSAKDLYCRENLRRQLLATSRIGLRVTRARSRSLFFSTQLVVSFLFQRVVAFLLIRT